MGVVLTTVGLLVGTSLGIVSTFASSLATPLGVTGALILTLGVMHMWNWRSLPDEDDAAPRTTRDRWNGYFDTIASWSQSRR